MKQDRLSRGNELDSYDIRILLKEYDVRFFENREEIKFDSANDLMMYQFKAMLAQNEHLRMKERFRDSHETKKNLGKKTHHRFYGYDLKRKLGKKESSEMIINVTESNTVKFIFEMYISGLSYSKINERLILEGHKRKNGSDKWNDSFLRAILKKPEYIGMTLNTSNEHIESQKFPAIIEESVWNQAQQRLKRNVQVNSKNHRVRKYALSGVIHCSRCGTGFYVRSGTKYNKDLISKDNPKGRYPYFFYHHRPQTKVSIECDIKHTTFKMERIDNLIMAIYSCIFSNSAQTTRLLEIQRNKLLEGHRQQGKEISLHQNRITELFKKRKNLIDMVGNGLVDMMEVKDDLQDLKNEIDTLEGKITALAINTDLEKFNNLIEVQSHNHIVDFLCMDDDERKKLYLKNLDITIDEGILWVIAVTGWTFKINLNNKGANIPRYWKWHIELMKKDRRAWEEMIIISLPLWDKEDEIFGT